MDIPRFVLAGTNSGSGKTSISFGLCHLFREAGYSVHPFKIGPDYIDPGYLTAATNTPCRNLDSVLMGDEGVMQSFRSACENSPEVKASFPEKGRQTIAVIEGVMGLYDGFDGKNDLGSTAQIAKLLKAPVVVIIDAKAMARTAGAVALGLKSFDPQCPVAGFIVNRIGSPRHYSMVRTAIQEATGLPVLGYLPKSDSFGFHSRHLGLIPAWEKEGLQEQAKTVAELLQRNVDIDGLLRIAFSAEPLQGPQEKAVYSSAGEKQPPANKPRIAVAMDDAFHFYYQDNLDFLEELGAKLIYFSPMQDQTLPEADALYFGGGYPEVFAKELSKNTGMLAAVKNAAEDEMPIYGECGGMMYLMEYLVDGDKKRFPMAGVFKNAVVMTKKLAALGYYSSKCLRDTPFFFKGEQVPGHVFHWSVLKTPQNNKAALFHLEKNNRLSEYDGAVYKKTVVSYLHVHFAGFPAAAQRLVDAAIHYRKKMETIQ